MTGAASPAPRRVHGRCSPEEQLAAIPTPLLSFGETHHAYEEHNRNAAGRGASMQQASSTAPAMEDSTEDPANLATSIATEAPMNEVSLDPAGTMGATDWD